MKKLLVILTALTFMVCFSAVSFAAISGTAHDFSSATWNPGGEICVTCHTPHNADTSVTDSPLWNHAVTTATFTVYNSGTLDAGPLGQPDGASKLCLSCHDGTVALDSFGGATGTTFISTVGTPAGRANVGIDLADDHPISFTYDDTLAGDDGELSDPSTTSSGLGGTIDEDMLFSGKLECASCHDAHGVTGVSMLLRKSNAASALCLTCHTK